ncbi:hypothetical protein Scep_001552 [Stephania cephalantha]|uniref:Uncharacterized protein n=1 Tax=Stephania cephalantha TaxID=152367 RepID=A0AAP0Q7V3_9MAGN
MYELNITLITPLLFVFVDSLTYYFTMNSGKGLISQILFELKYAAYTIYSSSGVGWQQNTSAGIHEFPKAKLPCVFSEWPSGNNDSGAALLLVTRQSRALPFPLSVQEETGPTEGVTQLMNS